MMDSTDRKVLVNSPGPIANDFSTQELFSLNMSDMHVVARMRMMRHRARGEMKIGCREYER